MLSNEALSHRNYVEGVLNYYREMDIQPGDPNEGTWDLAHYPLPRRLGGQLTVALLVEHHAVQGVLQSEEFGVCCTSGTYMKYLRGTEYEETMSYWLGDELRIRNRTRKWSPESRSRQSESQRKRFAENPVSEETRKKQSEVRTGKKRPPRSEEYRSKLAAGQRRVVSRKKMIFWSKVDPLIPDFDD